MILHKNIDKFFKNQGSCLIEHSFYLFNFSDTIFAYLIILIINFIMKRELEFLKNKYIAYLVKKNSKKEFKKAFQNWAEFFVDIEDNYIFNI